MLALFALICAADAPGTCREAMLSMPGPEACAAPREAADDWAAGQPEPLTATRAECRDAGPGLPFAPVGDGVFVHIGAVAVPSPETGGDLSNIGIVVGDASVAVFDSGGTRATGEAALAAIRLITDLPVSHVFLGHMHPDHIYGATIFAEAGAKVVAHADFAAALANRSANYRESFTDLLGRGAFLGSADPAVDIALDAPRDFDLGGRTIRAIPMPTAHTDNDLMVVDPQTGTLFASDLVFLQHVPALDGSLRGWQEAIARLADMDLRQVVPGHGPVAPFPDALGPTRTYLDALAADVADALDAGTSLSAAAGEIAQGQRPNWKLFDEYNIRNATAAYVELEWE